MKKSSFLFSIVFCALILSFYNNCGESFEASGFTENELGLNSEGKVDCQKIKQLAFTSNGFHGFLKTNCKDCHFSGGVAQGTFADDNSKIAFAAFSSFGWSRLSENAVDDNHPGPLNGPKLQSAVNSLNINWQSTEASYNTCVQSKSQNSSGSFDILSLEQNIKVTDKWETFRFELNNNFYENNSQHNLDIDFKVDIQNYYGEGEKTPQPIGYLFKVPRFEFKGSEDTFFFESITLYNNGVPLNSFKVWERLEILLEKQPTVKGKVADSVIIADDQRQFAYISDDISAVTNLSVVITKALDNTGGINSRLIPKEPNKVEVKPAKPVITRDVTYTDLIGNGEYGIFKKNCFQCHSGTNLSGGLALDKFNLAKASAAKIGSRIIDINRPMPTKGLMDDKSVAIIEKWIEIGSPQ